MLLQPGSLGIVVEFEAGHLASRLSFDLAHAALHDALPFVDNHDLLAEFLGLLQLVRGEDDGLAAPVHL